MLDVGFSEILVIFVLALIVLGPEKLPKVASQVGRWIGRARGMARQFREQLEEEVNLEQARKLQQPEPPPPITQKPSSPPPDSTLPSPALEATPYSPTPESTQQSIQPPDAPQSYPDTYSHAHPTDSEGRPLPAATSVLDAPATDPRQQDWVGGLTGADPATKGAADAARAQSHERGT